VSDLFVLRLTSFAWLWQARYAAKTGHKVPQKGFIQQSTRIIRQ
jgi:hypothetical protein